MTCRFVARYIIHKFILFVFSLLQLEFAYSAQPQLSDLHVHSLPIGSDQVLPNPIFTKRVIRHEFDEEGSIKSHSTKKKRKSSSGDGGSVVSEKKQKKLRKEKEWMSLVSYIIQISIIIWSISGIVVLSSSQTQSTQSKASIPFHVQ